MDLINYHHLKLFWAVAKEGNLTRASKRLHLTPQTVSMQIRDLESIIDEKLFDRTGRGLTLTEVGHVALQYAEEIFTLGQELNEALLRKSTHRPQKLMVGVADVLSKYIAYRLIEPAFNMEEHVRIICQAAPKEKLLADLAIHKLDVVLTDGPIPPSVMVRAYSHELGSCDVVFMAQPELASRLKKNFPLSLDGAHVLLPSEDNVLRRDLNVWFDNMGVHPLVKGEFDDTALMKTFGQAGMGFFPVPSIIADEVATQYKVRPIGTADGLVERYFAISVERKVKHPAVAAICNQARSKLFK